MRFVKIAAAALVLATPGVAMAQTSAASSLSLNRAASRGDVKEQLAGAGLLVALIALGAVVTGVIAVATAEDKPDSN